MISNRDFLDDQKGKTCQNIAKMGRFFLGHKWLKVKRRASIFPRFLHFCGGLQALNGGAG